MRNINPKKYLIDSIIVFLKFILWVQIVGRRGIFPWMSLHSPN